MGSWETSSRGEEAAAVRGQSSSSIDKSVEYYITYRGSWLLLFLLLLLLLFLCVPKKNRQEDATVSPAAVAILRRQIQQQTGRKS